MEYDDLFEREIGSLFDDPRDYLEDEDREGESTAIDERCDDGFEE